MADSPKVRAYLDIETTGSEPDYTDITVIGIAVEDGDRLRVIQLVAPAITDLALMHALDGVDEIYTFNGTCFDLPCIRSRFRIDLAEVFAHRDLVRDCRRRGLSGGLKKVEEVLDIPRATKGMNAYHLRRLWWDYVNNYNEEALAILLEYNREDTVNLHTLRLRLDID